MNDMAIKPTGDVDRDFVPLRPDLDGASRYFGEGHKRPSGQLPFDLLTVRPPPGEERASHRWDRSTHNRH
jgi:hypothetical protein